MTHQAKIFRGSINEFLINMMYFYSATGDPMKRLPTPRFVSIQPNEEQHAILRDHAEKMENLSASDILSWAVVQFHAKIAFATSYDLGDALLDDMLARISSPVPVMDFMERFLLPECWRPLEPHELENKYFDGTKASAALWERHHLEALCKRQEWKFRQYTAWIIGTPRVKDQRLAEMPVLSWNERFGVFRIAPFAPWKESQLRERYHVFVENNRNIEGLLSNDNMVERSAKRYGKV